MDKKTYLCRYHNQWQKRETLLAEIKKCEELSKRIPGPNYDQPIVGGTKSLEAPFIKWLNRKMDAELELKKAEDELEIIKKEILDAIAKIGDYECEIALIYRYIEWLSWKEISKSLFCSPTTARRIHDKALELFVVPEK